MTLKRLYAGARTDIATWTRAARSQRRWQNQPAARVADRVAVAARRRYTRLLERELTRLWTPRKSAQ